MSANLEQHDDRLRVLRVGGELKKSELDAAESKFVEIAAAGTIKLRVLLEDFTGWERGEAWGDTDFFFSHRGDFEEIAVVGNPQIRPGCKSRPWRQRGNDPMKTLLKGPAKETQQGN